MSFTMMMFAAAASTMTGELPPATAPVAASVEVMVLGTYHFGNPGRDMVNVKVDDVTSPRRQRELDALAQALLAFRPTRVMVEIQRPGPSYDVPEFAGFSLATLTTSRNEIAQIGYRVAALAHLPSVQGIDEQPGKGEPNYFPIGRVQVYAKAHGQQADVDAAFAGAQAQAARFEAEQATVSIPAMLIRYNDPATPMGGQDLYYSMLKIGDGDDQPGADLNAMWYLRNAKIFAKLINVAKPGDRVLVVYGSGHGYWLRHFASATPGYRLVDVMPYLRKAAGNVGR